MSKWHAHWQSNVRDVVSNSAVPVLITGFTLLGIGGCVRDIIKGKRAPYLLAWFIRTALCGLLFAALLAKGAALPSLALWSAQFISCVGIIAVTMYLHGRLGRLSQTDVIAIVLAAFGAAAWAMSGDAMYSVIGVVLAEGVATALGIRAAIRSKRFESTTFWVLALCAALLTLMTVDQASLIIAALFSVVNALTNIVAVRWVIRREADAVTSAA